MLSRSQNCQFKWYFAAGIPAWAPPENPHLVAPLLLSIHLPERREQRVFFTPGRTRGYQDGVEWQGLPKIQSTAQRKSSGGVSQKKKDEE